MNWLRRRFHVAAFWVSAACVLACLYGIYRCGLYAIPVIPAMAIAFLGAAVQPRLERARRAGICPCHLCLHD